MKNRTSLLNLQKQKNYSGMNYYEPYANKLVNLDETNSFLKKHKLLKPMQEEIKNVSIVI